MNVDYKLQYDLTSEETEEIEILFKLEGKEATPENIENYLKKLLEFYAGTDILKYAYTEKKGVEGVLTEALAIEYNTTAFQENL